MNRKWGVLLGTGLASIIVTIDFTIVNMALPALQTSLAATLSQLQWVVEAFGIPFCALLIIMGRLGDLKGHRRFLYWGMLGFGIASCTAGLSIAPWQLIASRFAQGLFGATIFPCGMAITADAFPKKERGRALGLYGGLLGIGLAIGPVLGGAILSFTSWHWLFFINVPLVFLSFAICLIYVRETKIAKEIPIDWKGVAYLILGLGSLVYLIVEGPNRGWDPVFTLSGLIISAFFLTVFYRLEKDNPSPILPFHLFRNRGFFLGSMSFVASISCVWPILFLLPLYLQNVLSLDAATAGWMLLAMTSLTVIAPPIAGYLLDKKGQKTIILLMFSCILLSYILQLFFTPTTSLWFLGITFVLFGFAWGAGNGIGMPLALSEIPSSVEAGVVSGAATTVLNVIGVFMLAVIGTVFRYAEKLHFDRLSAPLGLSAEQQQAASALLAEPHNAPSLLRHFNEHTAGQILMFFKESFAFGYQISVALLLGVIIVIFGAVLYVMRAQRQKK